MYNIKNKQTKELVRNENGDLAYFTFDEAAIRIINMNGFVNKKLYVIKPSPEQVSRNRSLGMLGNNSYKTELGIALKNKRKH